MKLSAATVRYVTHKQSIGMRFNTEARTLKSFCRAMGPVAMHEVEPDRVLAFLAGSGPVTQFWQRKHEILSRFYRFAIGRGYASFSPLPPRAPKPLGVFVPYIRIYVVYLTASLLSIIPTRRSTQELIVH